MAISRSKRKNTPKIKITAKGPGKTGCKLGHGQAGKNHKTLRDLERITNIEKEQL